jgi:Sulfotransferase family
VSFATLMSESENALHGKKLVFLVGAPRSGTTWLQLLLSRSPSVATTQEMHLFNLFMRSMIEQWNYDPSTRSSIGVTRLLSEEEYRTLLRGASGFVFAKIAQGKPSATVVLEKTPNNVDYWRVILDLWPDAHFIHIVRDPRSVVASLRVASRSWARHHFSSRIPTNCERWVSDVSHGRQVSSATRNYQQVTYEELIANGPEVLMRLLNGLGVATSLEESRGYVDECRIEKLKTGKLDNAPFPMTNNNESYRIGKTDSWRIELSKWEIALVEHGARELMSELGYAPANESKATPALAAAGWDAWKIARAAKRRLRGFAARYGLV